MSTKEEVQVLWKNADAICFDVDSTIIQDEAIDELAKFCGRGADVAKIHIISVGMQYVLGIEGWGAQYLSTNYASSHSVCACT
ncbi:unnamed protein product [Timema podura]|uniref:Phosphoserine phosphatase n=1 Tax=Timema podura TaxID=61482 RepID=A0ABN7PM79_TIMPD|nr:unnamed protein product [Timema podura]